MKIIYTLILIIIILYIVGCLILYFYQERIIFPGKKLSTNYNFEFDTNFEEITIPTTDNETLSGLYFPTKTPKGMIFYLHGNGGDLSSWGTLHGIYNSLGYDLFMLDYRGYGKSTGSPTSEKQMHEDVSIAYQHISKFKPHENIIIIGTSLGTGLAAKLAKDVNPKTLLLLAPYFNFTEIMNDNFKYIPKFLLKYKFETNINIKDIKCQVLIFHGTKDSLIPPRHSQMLQKIQNPKININYLPNQDHFGIDYNSNFLNSIKKL